MRTHKYGCAICKKYCSIIAHRNALPSDGGDLIHMLMTERDQYEEALIEIAKMNFAGPSTDERREWTWAVAYKALRETLGDKVEVVT